MAGEVHSRQGGDAVPAIIENLKMFNRKERFFLVGMALGKPKFKLGDKFWDELGKAFHLTVHKDAFTAMDYHLDWVYASLYMASNGGAKGPYSRNDLDISGSQEDMDLLVAYEEGVVCHVIMLEAKGVLPFANGPLHSKAERLSAIFGAKGDRWQGVIPHFAIVSPKEPQQLHHNDWPVWMKPTGAPLHIKLEIPPGYAQRKVVRCDQNGRAKKNGDFWKVIHEAIESSAKAH